jgi:hypothetical protein
LGILNGIALPAALFSPMVFNRVAKGFQANNLGSSAKTASKSGCVAHHQQNWQERTGRKQGQQTVM